MFNKKYKFTEEWFDPVIPLWTELFKQYKHPITSVLEIGCYEGRATIWVCENVLTDSSITYNYDVIDTFGGSLEESGMKGTKERLDEDDFIEDNFKHNISFFNPWEINFNIHKGFSQVILPTFPKEEKYDFIYIDASHRSDDTFIDAYYAHNLLKKGGLLIFDDFGWKDPNDDSKVNSPQVGITMFYEFYQKEYYISFQEYQVGLIKYTEEELNERN